MTFRLIDDIIDNHSEVLYLQSSGTLGDLAKDSPIFLKCFLKIISYEQYQKITDEQHLRSR